MCIVELVYFDAKQEYVLWNAVSVPLLQFARYCSIAQTLKPHTHYPFERAVRTGAVFTPVRTARSNG